MERLKSRLGWALAGALGIVLVLALARATVAGPLDPPGPVGSTMRTLDELLPSWGKTLTSSGGCTSQRFTCVMGNAAVLDHETGVVWQRVPAAASIDFLTADQTCREAKIGGRYGWRLPTIDELLSLDDDTTADSLPAGHPFTNTPDTYLWSQTADSTDAQRLQTMTFLNGGSGFSIEARARFGFNAADNARPWCVRGSGDAVAQLPDEQPAWARALSATGGCHSARFTCVLPTNADATGEAVLDHETGLVWQKTPPVIGVQLAGFGAQQECSKATTGGKYGWRLPSIGEIRSLLDPSVGGNVRLPVGHPFSIAPALNSALFISSTWQTTRDSPQDTSVHGMNLKGDPARASVDVPFAAIWCVRGAE